jgi:hypothetical protein
MVMRVDRQLQGASAFKFLHHAITGGSYAPQRHQHRDRAPAMTGSDAAVAELFRDLRQLLRLSEVDVAWRLKVPVDVIVALEQGEVDRLPPWPITERLVVAYTAMAGIDPRGVLAHLAASVADREQLSYRPRGRAAPGGVKRQGQVAGLSGLHAYLQHVRGSVLEGITSAVAALRSRLDLTRHRRLQWIVAGLILVSTLALVAPIGGLQASALRLPPPLAGLMRAISDQLTLAQAPVREGHRWIEVDDPRTRRGDKLR